LDLNPETVTAKTIEERAVKELEFLLDLDEEDEICPVAYSAKTLTKTAESRSRPTAVDKEKL
jgi:hypothetical protein